MLFILGKLVTFQSFKATHNKFDLKEAKLIFLRVSKILWSLFVNLFLPELFKS